MKINPLVFLSLCAILMLPSAMAGQEEKMEKKIPDFSLRDRKDVPKEYTWKIEDLFASTADWQTEKESVTRLIAQVDEKAKGWTSSAQAMLALLDLINQIDQKSSRLTSYASHQNKTDMGNTLYQGMEGDIRSILVQLNSKLAFMQPDVLALGAEKFAAFLQAEPKLAIYRFNIESILREKDHILPGDQQRIASLTGLFAGVPGLASGILNDVEIPPAEITRSTIGRTRRGRINAVFPRSPK